MRLLNLAALIFAVILSACTTTGTVSTSSQAPVSVTAVEYGCSTAATALQIVNANFAKLSAATKARVAQARAVTDPVCLMQVRPTLAGAAKAAFDGAISNLSAAQVEAQR